MSYYKSSIYQKYRKLQIQGNYIVDLITEFEQSDSNNINTLLKQKTIQKRLYNVGLSANKYYTTSSYRIPVEMIHVRDGFDLFIGEWNIVMNTMITDTNSIIESLQITDNTLFVNDLNNTNYDWSIYRNNLYNNLHKKNFPSPNNKLNAFLLADMTTTYNNANKSGYYFEYMIYNQAKVLNHHPKNRMDYAKTNRGTPQIWGWMGME